MDTRMSKYSEKSYSRVAKNKELYNKINDVEIDNFNLKSNATIIGDNNKNEIDLEQIKKILEDKYKEPQRKSIRIEIEKEKEYYPEETTKEYDINTILEKAKNEKEESYEEQKAKKIRDTQYDILKNLKIEKEEEKVENNNLLELINTIALNETKVKRIEKGEELDLFADLKSDNSDEKVKGMKDDNKNFFTTNNLFDKKDFVKEEIHNNEENIQKTSNGLKFLIIVLVIIFIFGIFILLKTILNF